MWPKWDECFSRRVHGNRPSHSASLAFRSWPFQVSPHDPPHLSASPPAALTSRRTVSAGRFAASVPPGLLFAGVWGCHAGSGAAQIGNACTLSRHHLITMCKLDHIGLLTRFVGARANSIAEFLKSCVSITAPTAGGIAVQIPRERHVTHTASHHDVHQGKFLVLGVLIY